MPASETSSSSDGIRSGPGSEPIKKRSRLTRIACNMCRSKKTAVRGPADS
jgi:hypothetical protein